MFLQSSRHKHNSVAFFSSYWRVSWYLKGFKSYNFLFVYLQTDTVPTLHLVCVLKPQPDFQQGARPKVCLSGHFTPMHAVYKPTIKWYNSVHIFLYECIITQELQLFYAVLLTLPEVSVSGCWLLTVPLHHRVIFFSFSLAPRCAPVRTRSCLEEVVLAHWVAWNKLAQLCSLWSSRKHNFASY